MSKKRFFYPRPLILGLFLAVLFWSVPIKTASAQDFVEHGYCTNFRINGEAKDYAQQFGYDELVIEFDVAFDKIALPTDDIAVCNDECDEIVKQDIVFRKILHQNPVRFTAKAGRAVREGPHVINLRNTTINGHKDLCRLPYTIYDPNYFCKLNLSSDKDQNGKELTPFVNIYSKPDNFTLLSLATIYSLVIKGPGTDKKVDLFLEKNPESEKLEFRKADLGRFSEGTYNIHFLIGGDSTTCNGPLYISPEGGGDLGETQEPGGEKIKEICVDVKPQASKDACEACFIKEKKTWTALGCIPTNDLNKLVAWLLGRLIFVATGIAFILLVIGALQILTSAGNPEKVKAGGELITSTISGLLLIILSLFLLRLIGVDILRIPGFGN